MTLLSRYRIRNSNPVGLRSSTITLGHGDSSQYWSFTSERKKSIVFFLKLEGQSGARTRDLRLSKQAALTTAPGYSPYCGSRYQMKYQCKLSTIGLDNRLQMKEKYQGVPWAPTLLPHQSTMSYSTTWRLSGWINNCKFKAWKGYVTTNTG